MSGMEKVTVRAPRAGDPLATLCDLCSMRTAPPLAVSLGLIMLLTGSIVTALLTVFLTSFVHAFWARLVQP